MYNNNILKELSSQFSSDFAKFLDYNLFFIAFCGPASFRDIDTDKWWIKKKRKYFFIIFLFVFIKNFIIGIKKIIFLTFTNFKYYKFNNNQKILSISPSTLCKIENDFINSEYLSKEDTRNVNWIVINYGKSSKIKRNFILWTTLKIIFACIKSFLVSDKKILVLIPFLSSINWIISLNWVNYYLAYKYINKIIHKKKPSHIFCIHELHPFSRIAWICASSNNIKSFTIQHASITYDKLWYFPGKSEINAGLKCPDFFYVYSDEVKKMLEKFYPSETKFLIKKSHRYKNLKKSKRLMQNQNKIKQILFIGSLAWWDNDIIFRGIKNILKNKKIKCNIFLRLHPNAKISLNSKINLLYWKLLGNVKISNLELYKEFNCADVIMGVSTTALLEASLYGINTVSIYDNDYNELNSTTSKIKIEVKELAKCSINKFAYEYNYTKEVNLVNKFLGINENLFYFKDCLKEMK